MFGLFPLTFNDEGISYCFAVWRHGYQEKGTREAGGKDLGFFFPCSQVMADII